MAYRPLSARGTDDPRFDTLHEGFPEWLHDPVLTWERSFLMWAGYGGQTEYNELLMRLMQLRLRMVPALDWRSPRYAAMAMIGRMREDETLALDVVDFTLNHMAVGTALSDDERRARAGQLASYLKLGGSAWEVTQTPDSKYYTLTRRALGPVIDAIEQTRSHSERAGAHLATAWVRMAGRNPDPGGAYREAVRAVEAAAKPIVSPTDSNATLGKMIRAIRDKPSKWTFALGTPDQVADACGMLWLSQFDRHGTDNESLPLHVNDQQADAAVHLALTLVRWFAGGAFAATSA